MPAKISTAKMAAALVDATVMSDIEAAKRNGIGVRTLERYRDSLEPDSVLAAEVQARLNEQDLTWSAELPRTLKAGIIALLSASQKLNMSDPEAVEALTKALTALSDIAMTRDVFRKRLDA